MMRGWFRSAGSGASLTLLESEADEIKEIEHTYGSAEYIMNDDPATAEKLLSAQDDAFHKQGLGVVTFLRATIGFEKEVMAEAGERLGEAEVAAETALAAALQNPDSFKSSIYPEGAVYMLCIAQARNLAAIVGLLNESVTEAVKGFLKLRKAFLALESIVRAEEEWLKQQGIERPAEAVFSTTSPSINGSARAPSVKPDSKYDESDDEDDFQDAEDTIDEGDINENYLGKVSTNGIIQDTSRLSLSSNHGDNAKATNTDVTRAQDDTTGKLITHPIDLYIHSGAAVNYGIMLLLISLIPPTFGKLLSLAGFKGDREKGLRMLWRVSAVPNINGSIAAFVLLAYYNVLKTILDIIPESAYPRERCQGLLQGVSSRYSKSRFWYTETIRTESCEKRLESSVAMCEKVENEVTQMKQVEALQWFEKAINTMCLHRYDDCAHAWLKNVEFNNWSHGLYFYIAGAAHLEAYRQSTDPAAADIHAAKAEELFLKVPDNVGKKKFIGRGLPFDEYINRKLAKWQARSREWHCRLADAAGISPLEEMIMHWSGYSKMRPEHLEVSLQNLEWNDDPKRNKNWERESIDEKATLWVLRGAIHRHLGRTEEARRILTENIIEPYKWDDFKGGHKDRWPAPIARYEVGVTYWLDSGVGKTEKVGPKERELLSTAKEWIEQVAKWDHYDLDTRFGMKVTVARNTLNRFLAM